MLIKVLLIVFIVPVLFTVFILIKWFKNPSKKTSYACSFCGEEVRSDTNFCPQCGSEFIGIKLSDKKLDKQAG